MLQREILRPFLKYVLRRTFCMEFLQFATHNFLQAVGFSPPPLTPLTLTSHNGDIEVGTRSSPQTTPTDKPASYESVQLHSASIASPPL